MRAWITSDSHFNRKDGNVGGLKYSKLWFDIMTDYYDNFFIPTVLENYKKGDILIHCGDLFDYGDFLETRVMNYILDLFERLVDIFGDVYLLCGNHDIYNKDNNDVNVIKFLKYMPGLTLVETKPLILDDMGKRIVMVPWQSTSEKEKEVLKEIGSSDYYFAHTTIQGALYSGRRKSEHGNDGKVFKRFGKVYTGHIHTTQKINNVRFVGSPYELTRNDAGNPKYIYCVDFQTGEEIEILNDYSPRYLKYSYENIKNMDESQMSVMTKNFIDVTFSEEVTDTDEYEAIMDKVIGAKPLDIKPVHVRVETEQLELIEDDDVREEITNSDIGSQVGMYLAKIGKYNEKVNEKVVDYIVNLSKKV